MEELSANVLAAIWLSVIYLDDFYPPIKAHLSGDFYSSLLSVSSPKHNLVPPGALRPGCGIVVHYVIVRSIPVSSIR